MSIQNINIIIIIVNKMFTHKMALDIKDERTSRTG